MKKIKLDSAKLILKKEIIGNLTNSEMANLIGGYGDTTGAGMCTDYTQQGGTQCQSNYQGNCTGPFPSAGCPPSHVSCNQQQNCNPPTGTLNLTFCKNDGNNCTIGFSITCPGNIC